MSLTTTEDRITHDACVSPKSSEDNSSPILPDIACKTPEKDGKLNRKHEILKDVTAYIEVRSETDDHFDGVAVQMRKMGAKVTRKFTADVTHVIYKEGTKSTRDKAIKRNIPIVNVLWVASCMEHAIKANETMYPIHMTPQRRVYKFMQPKSAEETAKNSADRVKRRQKRKLDSEKPALQEATETCSSAVPQTSVVLSNQEVSTKTVGIATENQPVCTNDTKSHQPQEKADVINGSLFNSEDENEMPETYIQKMAKKLQFDQARHVRTPSFDQNYSSSSDDEGISVEKKTSDSHRCKQQKSTNTALKQNQNQYRGSIEDFFLKSGTKRKATSEEQNEKKRRKKTQCLVMTSLHSGDQDVVVSVVEKLGLFTIQDTVTTQTTHVIAGDGRRTLNVLKAICTGCWILSLQWVISSLESGQWLDEEQYEMSEMFPSAKLSRLERSQSIGANYHSKLLANVPPIYVGKATSPPCDEIRKLIELAGGQVSNSYRKATLCIGDVPKKMDANHLTEKWLLDSITSNTVLSFEDYKTESPNRTHRSPSPTF